MVSIVEGREEIGSELYEHQFNANDVFSFEFMESLTGDAKNLVYKIDSVETRIPIPAGLDLIGESLLVTHDNNILSISGDNVVDKSGSVVGLYECQADSAVLTLTHWDSDTGSTANLASAVLMSELSPLPNITFRTQASPVLSDNLAMEIKLLDWELNEYGTFAVTFDGQGNVVGSDRIHGVADFRSGVISLEFYKQHLVSDVENSGFEWFSIENIYTEESGNEVVNEPYYAYASDMYYDAMAVSYLPLDSDLIGLDTVRLPTDGRVRFMEKGDVAVITERKTKQVDAIQSGDSFSTESRITMLELYDVKGKQVDTDSVDVDFESGSGFLNSNFIAGDYQTPLVASYRIMDSFLVNSVNINGKIGMSSKLPRAYSKNAVVSNAFVLGNLQATETMSFSQESWDGSWSDIQIGDTSIGQYQSATHPVILTNRSTPTERFAFLFTSETSFRIIGESLGQVGVGDTGSDTTIINPQTGKPYLFIPAKGWGQGWKAGNVVRKNFKSAMKGIWLGMAVQQHTASTQDTYDFGFEIHANIDRKRGEEV